MPPLVAFASWSPVLSLLFVYILPVSGHSELHTKRSGALNDRPPLNRALLGIQIGSICAAYVIFVAVLLALLLLVGRRLRRTVQTSNYSLHMQMLKPVKPAMSLDPSPVSPVSHNLPSPTYSHQHASSWGTIQRGNRPSQHSVNGSMVTIDESVVASDRQRAQDEMEMLYAAVMEHDAQKSTGVDVSVRDRDSQSQSPDSQYTNPFTDRHASYATEQPPMPPLKSPKSPRFSNSSRLSKLFSSNSRSNPDGGKLKSPKLPLRKLGISSPLASPDPRTPQTYSHEAPPLSPRFYNPGPPPVAPRAPPASAIGHGMPPSGRARPPAPLNLATASPQAQSSQQSLPFREAYPLQSAPATKTTILERPTKNRTGPITGVPTPYSAYMPFTPVTPFTPGRTVTKRQRRREEKENGLRVLNEDDLVKDDDDIWS